MADLFSVTAPLLIRYPDGSRDVMVERFAYPGGMVYFRPFWDRLGPERGICRVEGAVRGGGPWKIGAAVITVLGCQGTDPDAAAEFADWCIHREQLADDYPDREALQAMARAAGYLP